MPKKKVYDPEVKKLMTEISELKSMVKSKKKEIKEIEDRKKGSNLNSYEQEKIVLVFD